MWVTTACAADVVDVMECAEEDGTKPRNLQDTHFNIESNRCLVSKYADTKVPCLHSLHWASTKFIDESVEYLCGWRC